MGYWQNREAKAQEKLTKQSIKKVEAQLARYYASTMKKILGDFEKVYLKIFQDIKEGETPSPANLYKLDTYWQMQAQLTAELRNLGEKQAALLGANFTKHFQTIYKSLSLESEKMFATIDKTVAKEMINQIWCADGIAWSQRIWNNTAKLKQELNQGLIDCLVAGRKTSELKRVLQNRFGVSYSRANTLVRTEMAHIQTQAAAKRYQDMGIEKYQIRGNEEDTCGGHAIDCHEMDGKEFYYREMKVGVNAPPFHPNCRCCIVPVVD